MAKAPGWLGVAASKDLTEFNAGLDTIKPHYSTYSKFFKLAVDFVTEKTTGQTLYDRMMRIHSKGLFWHWSSETTILGRNVYCTVALEVQMVYEYEAGNRSSTLRCPGNWGVYNTVLERNVLNYVSYWPNLYGIFNLIEQTIRCYEVPLATSLMLNVLSPDSLSIWRGPVFVSEP